MSAARHAGTLQRMSNNESRETRGQGIKRRMEALGMGPSDLADEARLSRSQLYRVFDDAPNVREQSYVAAERTLDRLETEMGMNGGPDAVMSTEAGLMEFDVNVDAIGVHVVVKGPIANAAELEASVARLIRDIRKGAEDHPDLSDS
jgi:predicted transcriptional regulator